MGQTEKLTSSEIALPWALCEAQSMHGEGWLYSWASESSARTSCVTLGIFTQFLSALVSSSMRYNLVCFESKRVSVYILLYGCFPNMAALLSLCWSCLNNVS